MPLPLDLSHTDKPRQIQENLIAYFRLFAGLPGMSMGDDSKAFWFVANKRAPGDVILRGRFLSEHLDQQLDALFDELGRYIDHAGWLVFPGDEPADLNDRLEARGMPGTRAGNWLWTDLTSLGTGPAIPDNFRVERVNSDQMMAEWTRLSSEGFGADESCFYDAYARHGYDSYAFSLHYIGYLDDTPVTSGTLLDAGGTAALYDISTPPAFRRRGAGGALTYAMMREIRSRGYTETWIWSSDMAIGVYQSLGYVDANFGVREHNWQRP